jgi:hypothetical protein
MEFLSANLVRHFHRLPGKRCAKLKAAKFFLMPTWQIALVHQLPCALQVRHVPRTQSR